MESESRLGTKEMSRICVKNLPKYVAEDRLREFFSQKGEVTDAKLMRTKDGNSRQFGFVGFRTPEEAEEAIKYFHKSFMDTYRITCEVARKVGDPDIPRPWSRYSMKKEEKSSKQGKEATVSESLKLASKEKKKKNKNDDENGDPQLQEFLQVMQPRSKSKLWANDSMTATSAEQRRRDVDEKSQVKGGDEKLTTMVAELNESDEEENLSSESQDAYKRKDKVHDEVISDMDYFKSRVKKAWLDLEDENENDSAKDSDSENDDSKSPGEKNDNMLTADADEDGVQPEENRDASSEVPHESEERLPIMNDERETIETGRLFVRNLSYSTTEEELEEHFRKFGNISQVHIVVDKDTKRSKGIAYVLYALPESASRALEELDNSIFQGRLLHVMVAKQNKSSAHETNLSNQQSSKTLKQKKLEERKASEASGNTRSWNSLFMRPDTVVENIARKFGVSKSDLLDKEAADLAVRIALGETQVIAETKKALSVAGVNIASLEEFTAGKTDGIKRSNHVILVKNLPYGSSEGDLANMFGKFGSVEKIILPPSKVLALVVFLEAAEARAAFKSLAYKRYKDAPLYLEWAPGNILSQGLASVDNSENAIGERDVKKILLEEETGRLMDADVDPDRVESRSVYVKNLNFKTADENLKKHFTEHMKEGRVLSVRVKKHLKNGKNLSMGFGFIEFDSIDTAMSVCKDLQGTVLDGHALTLQLCHAKKNETVPKDVENDGSSTKLIVRNVAFEATEKDLRQLFSPFGQIKSLRLPMRYGNHRGFAFVEYVTKQEAKNALKALSNTHLYGRHLVVERAKEGESLEDLRARTAAQFEGQGSTKLSKKRKHMAVLDEGSLKFERLAD